MIDKQSVKKLKKTLNPKKFRFVIILYDDTTQIPEIKSIIKELYPNNFTLTLDIKEKDYNSLASNLYQKEEAFIYIDDW